MDAKKVTEATGSDRESWRAIAERLAKLETMHSATCRLEVKMDSGGYRSFVAVVASASLPILTGPALPLSLSVSSHYPIPRQSSMASLCLALLDRLERRINEEVYRQRELPLTPPQG